MGKHKRTSSWPDSSFQINTGFVPRLYDGTMHDMGIIGSASGINDNGLVSGYSTSSTFPHAFFYDGAIHRIDSGYAESVSTAINANGQITGYISAPQGPTQDDALIYDGKVHDIGGLGGTFATGNAINNIGHVVGSAATPQMDGHAFFYDGTQIHDLGTLGGTVSTATGINDSDVIVGISETLSSLDAPESHGFIFTSAMVMVDLNDLIDPESGWLVIEADAINDLGEIAGAGMIDGQEHAILLAPVPEPSALSLIMLGVAILASRSAKRSVQLRSV